MLRLLRIVFGLAVGVTSGISLAVGWTWWRGTQLATMSWEIPAATIAVPWPAAVAPEEPTAPTDPPSEEQGDEPPLPAPDPMEEAVERGRALVQDRLRCHACHGDDLGGVVVVDDPVFGVFAGPNLTEAVRGEDAMVNFERALRHGVRPDGVTSLMPAIDYAGLSDREISDLFAYVSDFPPVDRRMPRSELGPALVILAGLGNYDLPPFVVDQEAVRPELPPVHADEVSRGRRLAASCRGCHGPQFEGALVPGADPTWPTASNLTPHTDGLAGWTTEDFLRAMREGRSKDGRAIDPVMPWQAMSGLTDDELSAMFAYLRTLEPRASSIVEGPPWRALK